MEIIHDSDSRSSKRNIIVNFALPTYKFYVDVRKLPIINFGIKIYQYEGVILVSLDAINMHNRPLASSRMPY